MKGPTRYNYRTRQGVQLTGAQVQSFRQFVGLSMPWARTFSWDEKQWKDALSPFFFGRDQEWYHQIATWQLGDRYADLISTRPEIRKAVFEILMHVVERIADGQIWYDKYASRLKTHQNQKCDCKIMLYNHLNDYINATQFQIAMAEQEAAKSVAKRGKSEYGNETVSLEEIEEYIKDMDNKLLHLEHFRSEWDEVMEKEMNLYLNCLQTGDDNKGIVDKIRKKLQPPDPRLLDGKIRKLRNGNYRFQNPEDLQMEYKQSMFSPDIKKIDKTVLEPEVYKKKVAGRKNDLINEICSSVCAFLNTNDGSIYIGVHDDTRNIIGLSDDKKHKDKWETGTYTGFQEKYKIEIMNEIKKRITTESNQPPDLNVYINDIKYHGPYGKEDIDIIEIPCKKIPSSESPVWLKNKLDKEGNSIKGGERKLYRRIITNSGSEEEVPKNEEKKFFKKCFKEWYEHDD